MGLDSRSRAGLGSQPVGARHAGGGHSSSRLVLDEGFSIAEVSGMVLIGTGLASLSLLGWIASRRANR